MQKKVLISLIILIISLGGCGGSKTTKKAKKSGNNAVDMTVAADKKPKTNFFDENIHGGFEDVDTFVLDEETNDSLKNAISGQNSTLVWSEPTNPVESQKEILYFEYGTDRLRDDQSARLPSIKSRVEEWLNKGYTVVFKGHACLAGEFSRTFNIPLSGNRAEKAKDLVLGNAQSAKIKTFGVGSEEPVVLERTKDAQTPNRRVEVYPLA